jgi:hypothetical protein
MNDGFHAINGAPMCNRAVAIALGSRCRTGSSQVDDEADDGAPVALTEANARLGSSLESCRRILDDYRERLERSAAATWSSRQLPLRRQD